MLVVVDTNVMLSAFARQSPVAPLFRALAAGKIRMAVTAAIVLEYEEIAERRGQLAEQRDDILSLLLAARDEEGQPLTERELRDELLTLLVAGHETTATALSWAL